MHRIQVTARTNVFTIDAPAEPTAVRLDPNLKVLMEASFSRTR
jgi:hypothetical protein